MKDQERTEEKGLPGVANSRGLARDGRKDETLGGAGPTAHSPTIPAVMPPVEGRELACRALHTVDCLLVRNPNRCHLRLSWRFLYYSKKEKG